MLARVRTSTLSGLDATKVSVEVELRRSGGPQRRWSIIGLGDNAVKEAKDRVCSALRHSGFSVPDELLVNLAPAELKKEGSAFDVAIAIGALVASKQLPATVLDGRSFHGELGLDGSIGAIRGALALTIDAMHDKLFEIIVPKANSDEASLIDGIDVIPTCSLGELVAHLNGNGLSILPKKKSSQKIIPQKQLSLNEVWGQESAKRAMQIAAAGGHNLLFVGPPGCGKTMLAERFGSLLPPLSRREMLETIRVHSIAGHNVSSLLSGERPFRAPHHTLSDIGLIGGGSIPHPGEISLAHRGVLFLDEFPEFKRSAIEALRAPLESGRVRITRAKGSHLFPARFQLIAAMNPCPCGRLGVDGARCGCSHSTIQSYLKKLSQPILDRIDIHVDVKAVPVDMLSRKEKPSTNSDDIAQDLVTLARERQYARAKKLNSELSGKDLEALPRTDGAMKLLEVATRRLKLSARGFVRTLRVARTIADFENSSNLTEAHVAEAIGYRSIDRIRESAG